MATKAALKLRETKFPVCLIVAFCGVFVWSASAHAIIKGVCSDCHTMHNSQDGSVMADFAGESGPNPALTRGSCYGCHAQASGQALVSVGTASIPQVMHTNGTDLAGGNFAYITGAKGSGGSDAKGHNIADLTGSDGPLYAPPGGLITFFHNDGGNVNADTLSCAGTNGCHGYRYAAEELPDGIPTAHHNNVDGKLEVADKPSNSYRFLTGVKGLEDNDWQHTLGPNDHNEYTARTTPIKFDGCGGTTGCHVNAAGIQPPDGTISQFCATCHGNFHTLTTTGYSSTSDGVGVDASSPFIRHPTDFALPNDGEYGAVTSYSLIAPVGRTGALPDTPSNTANSSAGDAVTCLSCHVAHASDYPDMLRWDYLTDCDAGTANADCGCFACHTTKDD